MPDHTDHRQLALDAIHARLGHAPLARDADGELILDADGEPRDRHLPRQAKALAVDGLAGIVRGYLQAVGPDRLQRELRSMQAAGVGRLALDPRALAEHFDVLPPAKGFSELSSSPGDVPSLLAESINRSIADNFTRAPRLWRAFARPGTATSLHDVSRPRFDDLALLDETAEANFRPVSESATETHKMRRHIGGLSLTRRMIVNDDLGVLEAHIVAIAQAAARVEDDLAFGILIDNPTLADGVKLFADVRNNNNQGNPRNGVATLAAVKDAGGNVLDVPAGVVLVSPLLQWETADAIAHVARMSSDMQRPPQIVTTARLNNIAGWDTSPAGFVLGDPRTHAAIELTRLIGGEEPQVAQRVDFATEALKVRVTHHVGAGVLDPRFAVRCGTDATI